MVTSPDVHGSLCLARVGRQTYLANSGGWPGRSPAGEICEDGSEEVASDPLMETDLLDPDLQREVGKAYKAGEWGPGFPVS